MLRNSVPAIGLGLLASPLLIAGQVVSASAQTAPTVDLLGISGLNAERPVIDPHVDERQRYGL